MAPTQSMLGSGAKVEWTQKKHALWCPGPTAAQLRAGTNFSSTAVEKLPHLASW